MKLIRTKINLSAPCMPRVIWKCSSLSPSLVLFDVSEHSMFISPISAHWLADWADHESPSSVSYPSDPSWYITLNCLRLGPALELKGHALP